MNGDNYPIFTRTFDANKIFFPIEYKYLLIDKENNSVVCWENGENRYLNPNTDISDTDLIIVNDTKPCFNTPQFKGCGTAIPVFSLRTKQSFGIGEFEDLKLLVDWASKTEQKLIQTLPINDTTSLHTWKDSYPYCAISVFA